VVVGRSSLAKTFLLISFEVLLSIRGEHFDLLLAPSDGRESNPVAGLATLSASLWRIADDQRL